MITGNIYFNRVRGPNMPSIPSWEGWRLIMVLPELAMRQIPEQGYDEGPPLPAYVNHGRWVVKCECGGCELAWEEGAFVCMACLNASHGHRYRRSVFPVKRREIERLLLVRPIPNRNWMADEAISHLRAENAEHKAELLGGAK